MLGIFGDPNMIEYGCGTLDKYGQVVNTSTAQYLGTTKSLYAVLGAGACCTRVSFHQLWEQFRAAIFVIFWSALITFILMKLIGLLLHGAAYKDEVLEVGDMAIHGEEAYPDELAARVGVGGGSGLSRWAA